VVAVSIALYLLKKNFRDQNDSKIIFIGLLLFAAQYWLEIFYWTIAVTSRIGYMDKSISDILYSNSYVSFVKLTDLISGVILLLVILRLFKLMDKRIEWFFSTRYFENSHESIVILNPKKKIVHLNRAAEIKFCLPSNQAKGNLGIPYLTTEIYQNRLDKLLDEINSNNLNSKRVISPDPKEQNVYNEISISPFFDINNTRIEGFNVNVRRIINDHGNILESPFYLENVLKNIASSNSSMDDSDEIIASLSDSFRKEGLNITKDNE